MKRVGHHLQLEAMSRTDVVERDLFGRSSFNRYYYATYWIVRDLLKSLDASWASQSHAGVPKLLGGQVHDVLLRGKARARRTADTQLVSLCSQALSAVTELSSIMTAAYAIRVVADYQPENSIKFEPGDGFTLNSVGVEVAYSWPNRATLLCNSIRAAWRQVNA